MATDLSVNPAERLKSLDAYRGFTMLLMASSAFGLDTVAAQFPDNPTWQWIRYHFSHAEWRWGGLWDMIQPSFTFMVGLSMVYSYSRRAERGQSPWGLAGHAAYRALLLIALGVLLRSRWTFEDVLSQIGGGYFFLFLLWNKSWRVQVAALIGILVGYWALFAFWPLPPENYDWQAVGVSREWFQQNGLAGFEAHWNMNANPAHYFDVWFLNLFPREEPFTHNGGGYQTLSFIPSLATMVLGLLAGQILRGGRSRGQKILYLMGIGLLCLGIGVGLDRAGVCPIVKRIWTPTWTLYSGGIAFIVTALFYGVVDVIRFWHWAWIGIVVGLNSIAMYVMAHLIDGWIDRTIRGLCGEDIYTKFNVLATETTAAIDYSPIVRNSAILTVLWFLCFLMYRNRWFIRI